MLLTATGCTAHGLTAHVRKLPSRKKMTQRTATCHMGTPLAVAPADPAEDPEPLAGPSASSSAEEETMRCRRAAVALFAACALSATRSSMSLTRWRRDCIDHGRKREGGRERRREGGWQERRKEGVLVFVTKRRQSMLQGKKVKTISFPLPFPFPLPISPPAPSPSSPGPSCALHTPPPSAAPGPSDH